MKISRYSVQFLRVDFISERIAIYPHVHTVQLKNIGISFVITQFLLKYRMFKAQNKHRQGCSDREMQIK